MKLRLLPQAAADLEGIAFLVLYRVGPGVVEILRVLHERRGIGGI